MYPRSEGTESGKSYQDAPLTAENFTPVAGALLVAVGRSRPLVTDRTRTVAGSRAHPTPRGSEDAMPPTSQRVWTLTADFQMV